MADYIGGIAILDRRDARREHLFCFGFRDGQHPTYISIPVYPKGTPKPSECAWEYEVIGDSLACCPSVRQMSSMNGPDRFHNTYNWTVKYQDCVADPYEELKAANPDAAKIFE